MPLMYRARIVSAQPGAYPIRWFQKVARRDIIEMVIFGQGLQDPRCVCANAPDRLWRAGKPRGPLLVGHGAKLVDCLVPAFDGALFSQE